MLHSFTYDSIASETKDLTDLQSNFGMKTLFKETPYPTCWGHLLNVPEFSSMSKRAISVFLQMPTKYLCENGFLLLCEIKSRKRNLMTHIDPLMTDEEQLKRISFLGLECWFIICNSKKVIKIIS